MNRYLIIGAAGSVGSALVDRLLTNGKVVCAYDNSEDGMYRLRSKYEKTHYAEKLRCFLGDVRDYTRLSRACEGVDYVVHAAALKHVELTEFNVLEAVETNVNGVKNVVNACLDSKVKRAIFTSSDKAVNPTSAMGATKLIGERIFISANNLVGSSVLRFSCTRFGNVLDSNGSVLKIFKDSVKNEKPFPITDINMTRFFLTMQDAVDLCIHALENTIGGEIFVKSMGAASIKKLAQAVACQDEVNIQIIGTKLGEKLWEELITEIEASRTIHEDDVFTIFPEIDLFTNEQIRGELAEKYKNRTVIDGLLSSVSDELDWQSLRGILTKSGALEGM